MTIIEIGYDRFDNIKSHAYWSNIHIDTIYRADREECIEDYISHLNDCKKHPTTGLLAKRKYITSKKWNYPEYAIRNLNILEKQPDVDKLQKSINEKINTLYPKTKHIRQYIINNDRILLDTIEKSRKYSLQNKLAIILKNFI